MVGLPILLGATSTPLQVFAQIPGHALRLQADAFKREVQNGTSLEQILQRYTQALFTQLSQSVACNRLHSVEQRCARWLLLTADRVGQQAFKLTQEFLAQMLGVRRASVNPILQNFQKNGIIKYKQGQMELRKRRALERVSCECYEIVRREYQKLIGKG
jgi:CRP-like cAMP-binding protein